MRCRSRARRTSSRSTRAGCPGRVCRGPGPSSRQTTIWSRSRCRSRSTGRRRARAARCDWPRASAMHVDHEHAAAALPQANPRGETERAAGALHRCDGLGELRTEPDDAVQPGPAGVSAAGGSGQRAAGPPAHEFQGGALRPTGTPRCCARWRRTSRRRYDTGDGKIELPVKLKVHDSVFVPLAKWAMLIAGNYRCVQEEGVRSIKEAVHSDIEASRAVYNWVRSCASLGADAARPGAFRKVRRTQRECSAGHPPPRAHWPRARRTSSASTGSCNDRGAEGHAQRRVDDGPSRWSIAAGSQPQGRRLIPRA